MNRKTCVALVLLASMIGAGVARAGSPTSSPAAVGPAPQVPPGAPEHQVPATPREKLSPMHREIFDAVEAERAQVKALSDRYARAALPAEKLEIQKEIESVKKAAMIGVFEIQLRYARTEGRGEAMRQLETALEALRNPKLARGTGPTLLEQARGTGEN